MKKLKLGLFPKVVIAIVVGALLGLILPDVVIRIFKTFNPFLFITRYLSANIKHVLRYESRGTDTGAPKIHDFMAHRQSNFGKSHKKQDRCAKIIQILVAPVIYLVSRFGRVMELPLQTQLIR